MAKLVIALLFVVLARVDAWEVNHYICSACREAVGDGVRYGVAKFGDACSKALSKSICDTIFGEKSEIMNSDISKDDDFCYRHHMCTKGEAGDRDYASYSTSTPNVRVARAMGPRGYDKVRVSLVTNTSLSPSDFPFGNAYMNQFKHKWTQFYLATTIVDVVPGEVTTVKVQGTDVKISIPKENQGVRGVIIADPCFQSQWVSCRYQESWNTFDRLTSLLNAASVHSDDINYFQLLGDNFYDQDGAATNAWWNALSLDTKSKSMLSVPGNHDTWVHGSPKMYTSQDQLQHGFFQFYGQDVVASLSAPLIPYDFSVDPNLPSANSQSLPPASNLFTYNKIGNMIFIGFSGAHSYEEQEKYFIDACNWAQTAGSDVILLEGHWNNEGDGCPNGMSVPEVYAKIKSIPACEPLAPKMRYFMGHEHCDLVVEKDIGFMVGSYGMSDSKCDPVFGFNVVDTTGGSFKVYNFKIVEEGSTKADYYADTLKCFQDKGVSGCYGLPNAQLWADVKF